MPTLSSREFNHHPTKAKQSADKGPVVITERGRPTHVLLTWEEYRRLTGKQVTLLDALAPAETKEIEFEPPRHEGSFHRNVSLED